MALQNLADLFASDSELTQWIKQRPLTAVALGAAAGFVWGGGTSGRLGRSFLLYLGQTIVRDTVAHVLSEAIVGNARKPPKP
jgi:hypothetical protein